MKKIGPSNPGSILADNLEFLRISPKDFASQTGIPLAVVETILAEKAPVMPQIAEKISLFWAVPMPPCGFGCKGILTSGSQRTLKSTNR